MGSGWAKLRMLVTLGLSGYLGVVLMLFLVESRLIYPGAGGGARAWSADGVPLEELELVVEDGTALHGVWLEHPDPRAVVLFFHGNGEMLSDRIGWLNDARRRYQISLLAVDYRGYGLSAGRPSERALVGDALWVTRWAAEWLGTETDQLLLWGCSLGGGVAAGVAEQMEIRGLILERTFHSLVEVAAGHYPWMPVRLLMRNRYDSAGRLADYHGPLLQLHGEADRIVPLASARRLHEAVPSSRKRWVTARGMDHNDPMPRKFQLAVESFLQELSEDG
jgi:fermentation-respiration switch protein FrsA (DUF1100 family)